MVDALTASVTLTPLVQPAAGSSAPAHLQVAAAAAWAAKLPQLTTLRLRGVVGDSLGEWLASPFGSCAGLAHVTRLQLEADACPEPLVAAMMERCTRLQSLELAFAPAIYKVHTRVLHPAPVRSFLQGLAPRLRRLHVRKFAVAAEPVASDPAGSGLLPSLAHLAGLEALQ